MSSVTKAAAVLGRRGGQSTSVAKQNAARVNGRKGGRPKKKGKKGGKGGCGK